MNTIKALLWTTFFVGISHVSPNMCMSVATFTASIVTLDRYYQTLMSQGIPTNHPAYTAMRKLKQEALFLQNLTHTNKDIDIPANEAIFANRLNYVLNGQYDRIIDIDMDSYMSGPEMAQIPTIHVSLGNKIFGPKYKKHPKPTYQQLKYRRSQIQFEQEKRFS